MRKVKTMLTVIVLLAVVGGTLAFKAKKKFVAVCIYTSLQPGICGSPYVEWMEGTFTDAGASKYLTFASTAISIVNGEMTRTCTTSEANCNWKLTYDKEF
jgi:hypothetical protein